MWHFYASIRTVMEPATNEPCDLGTCQFVALNFGMDFLRRIVICLVSVWQTVCAVRYRSSKTRIYIPTGSRLTSLETHTANNPELLAMSQAWLLPLKTSHTHVHTHTRVPARLRADINSNRTVCLEFSTYLQCNFLVCLCTLKPVFIQETCRWMPAYPSSSSTPLFCRPVRDERKTSYMQNKHNLSDTRAIIQTLEWSRHCNYSNTAITQTLRWSRHCNNPDTAMIRTLQWLRHRLLLLNKMLSIK